LEVVEAGGDERCEPGFFERQAGSDEIDVETRGAGGADEIDDVGAGERLAAGEIDLKDAGFGGLLEDSGPDFRGELICAGLHFERIGTVDAMQGAAVGQFGD
jgi:hypothetical protein